MLLQIKHFIFFSILFCASFVAAPIRAEELNVILHRDNPTPFIDDQDLASYFTKNKKTWPHGLKVVPFDFVPSKGEKAMFLKTVLHITESEWFEYWTQMRQKKNLLPPLVLATPAQMIDLVAFDPSAIGYVLARDLKANDLQRVRVIRTLNVTR